MGGIGSSEGALIMPESIEKLTNTGATQAVSKALSIKIVLLSSSHDKFIVFVRLIEAKPENERLSGFTLSSSGKIIAISPDTKRLFVVVNSNKYGTSYLVL